MHSCVCAQAAAGAEALATDIAGERALAGIAAEVNLEVASLRKGFHAAGVSAGLLRDFSIYYFSWYCRLQVRGG